ncbi:MAG TPA: SPASM domain-containing protein [Smithellaceae bacterium]|nr:SPASM domain-containing protein [Smithellaceae bacterium]
MNNYLKLKAQHIFTKISMYKWMKNPQFCKAVEIETINRCNGTCSFCPVNRRDDPRQLEKMSDDLLQRILLDLHAHNYAGFLGLQSNNEPLLDKNIVKRIALAREMCLHAHLYMYTNGVLLTFDMLTALFDAGLDSMVIDNYSENLQLHPHIESIAQKLKEARYSSLQNKIKISIMSPKAIRSNRGGQAPNKQGSEFEDYLRYKKMGCILPFEQLVIRPKGEISLCCQDALGRYTLGDMRKMTLDEIWYGEPFTKVRYALLEKGRQSLNLCKRCDGPAISRTYAFEMLRHLLPWYRNKNKFALSKYDA